jgi:hypothetical protein
MHEMSNSTSNIDEPSMAHNPFENKFINDMSQSYKSGKQKILLVKLH